MHEYTVEFRIYGKELDSAVVTADLGLAPTEVIQAGTKRDPKTTWDEAMWSYNGFPNGESAKSWESLEEGLMFVLQRLWPVKRKLEKYKLKHKLILWCGNFQSSFDGGPCFSPSILKMLGDFGVELFIDNYLTESEKPTLQD